MQLNEFIRLGDDSIFPVERRNEILRNLKENGSITVEELAEKLGVAQMTVRRDLKILQQNNMIERTFGGAILKEIIIPEIPYEEKSESNKEEKFRIADKASTFVKEGEVIILDAGTTNMEIARKIKDMKNIKVVTTDLMIAALLSNNANIEVICTGGQVQSLVGECIGTQAIEFLANINADVAFIGASSIDIEKGITTPSLDKSKLKRQMILSSEKVILVCDSSKFGNKSFVKVCSLDELDYIITDKRIDDEEVKEIIKINQNLILV